MNTKESDRHSYGGPKKLEEWLATRRFDEFVNSKDMRGNCIVGLKLEGENAGIIWCGPESIMREALDIVNKYVLRD